MSKACLADPAEAESDTNREKLYRQASNIALITIFYNLLEGGVSIWFGAADETLSLFGFGVDSVIEVVSAVGVWHMLQRVRANRGKSRDEFEKSALKVTGASFYVLATGLTATALIDLRSGHRPETTVSGIVISLLSIAAMWFIIHFKTRIGKALDSAAILADAACSRACLWLSLVLLAASLGYHLTGLGSLDAAGAALIGWLAFKEGREAFRKTRGGTCSCCPPSHTSP